MVLSLFAHILTFPYRLVLWLRHKCYDWGVFLPVSCNIPTLSIGNIGVGGTGKTPHVELFLRLLGEDVPMAMLSRGYKRSSKGFRYVTPDDSAGQAGDEPLQIKRKFPSVVVAVDANRIEGIRRIQHDHPHIKLIVLDDAFQYRRLKPSCSILLSDYNRPYTQDLLLPFGRLRDLPSQASRADMIIVTKAPPDLSSEEREKQSALLKPTENQQLLFSYYLYGTPLPLFPEAVASHPGSCVSTGALVVTGIANPTPFLQEIAKKSPVLEHLKFPDHHRFTKKDVQRINALIIKHPTSTVYTTEKDAMRLLELYGLSEQTKAALYYIPVEVEFCTADPHRSATSSNSSGTRNGSFSVTNAIRISLKL